ncbi:MAG: ROK family transcriptional regulator [Candidatus Sumerlaeia bacterium]|nr:ROK family transcriptional regulator [Candidatus Sumerlaeia bacterium]
MLTKRADTSSLKSHNLLLLLRRIRENQPVSAKVLVESTGMRASSVSRLLRTLSDRGLIASRGMENTGNSGRPTELWGINGAFGASIGLYMASNLVAGVMLDLDGNILDTCVIPFKDPESQSPTTLLGLLHQALERLSKSDRLGAFPLVGVGIASMGLVDRESSVIRFFDARVDVSSLNPFPGGALHVENDANAVARGEAMHRHLTGISDAIVLYAHEGIGAGLILNGILHQGFGGAAGEVGYRACQLISNPLDGDDTELHERFYNGVCSMINLLNPQALLLTGDLSLLPEEIVNTLRERIASNTNPVAREVRMIVAPCNPMDVARHMAMLVLEEEVYSTSPVFIAQSRDRLEEVME